MENISRSRIVIETEIMTVMNIRYGMKPSFVEVSFLTFLERKEECFVKKNKESVELLLKLEHEVVADSSEA